MRLTGRREFGRAFARRMLFVTVWLFGLGAGASASRRADGLHTDIEYGRAGDERLLLDASVPQSPALHPMVILIHGGGWGSGNKQDMAFLFEPLCEAGFTVFSINYRLAPTHRWPACIDDVTTAIRWVKTHAADYKGNSDKMALIGYSAGGHLACLAAVEADAHTRVQAVVGLAAPVDHQADSDRRGGLSTSMQNLLDRPKEMDADTKAVLYRISPINKVHPGLPPFLLIHGTQDTSVPFDQSVRFQAKLSAYNVPCELVTIDGASHRIAEWESFGVDYKQKMVDWLRKTFETERSDKSEIIVNADGTGDFTTVQAAVDAVRDDQSTPTVIRIRPGTYTEKIVVPASKRFIRFQGENAETTVLSYHLSARMKDEKGEELGTFRTPSVTLEADDFTAENITFENTAGDVGQALAVTVLGDRAVFRHCRFLGWQDTILDHAGRHYYENCTIAGHCDFIFGAGTAFFEKCRIHSLQGSYITAASTPQDQAYGYVFSNCTITGDPDVPKTYLGRPWRDYANVIFLNTEMSACVRPEGWHNWSKPEREQTARYAEYNSTGPGATPQVRAAWSRQLTVEEARQITIQSVLSGEDNWNPAAGSAAADTLNEPIEPINAPFPMPPLQRPAFAARVVDIRDHGAVADARTDNTNAFSAAIGACADAGGGRVLVPAGRWLTGPIHLRSQINLYLAQGAEIIFSDRFDDYLPVVAVRVGGVELYNYSPLIYARDCENVAVTGPGTLNGNAEAWWLWKSRETPAFFEMAAAGVPVKERVFGTPEAAIRPSFLCLYNCRNVLLEGFTIGSGPNWTIHPVYCENVIIRRVNVKTDGPNNDGIDPDSCRNVLIEHCTFDTGDDCVVLKSGYNEDGWRVGRPTENVVMRYCSSRRGHGGLVIGSEMSGDVRNVFMHDCTFEGTDRAIRVKSRRGRGGIVENVWARDLTLKNMKYEAVILNMDYSSDQKQARSEKPPVFRNFDIRNLTCEGAPAAIVLRALEDAPIANVHFENITIASTQGIVCENVRAIVFDRVTVTPRQGPVYRVVNGCDITIRENVVPPEMVFVEVSGAGSSDIRIRQTEPFNSEWVAVKDGAAATAVSIE